MTDKPMTRAEARRRGRQMAVQLGYAKAEEADAPPVKLPTLEFGALRALLNRGHLTPDQAEEARALLAEADGNGPATPPVVLPPDAA